jgi:hypothetical protein
MTLPTSKLKYCIAISVSETSLLMNMGMAFLSTGISALGLVMTRHLRDDRNERFVYHHPPPYIY